MNKNDTQRGKKKISDHARGKNRSVGEIGERKKKIYQRSRSRGGKKTGGRCKKLQFN